MDAYPPALSKKLIPWHGRVDKNEITQNYPTAVTRINDILDVASFI